MTDKQHEFEALTEVFDEASSSSGVREITLRIIG